MRVGLPVLSFTVSSSHLHTNNQCTQALWLSAMLVRRSCLMLLWRIFLPEAKCARRFMIVWMFSAVEHAFVTFLVPPSQTCYVFGLGLLGAHYPSLTCAIGRIHYFNCKGSKGWSFNNTTTTWRMRTIHHMPESD